MEFILIKRTGPFEGLRTWRDDLPGKGIKASHHNGVPYLKISLPKNPCKD